MTYFLRSTPFRSNEMDVCPTRKRRGRPRKPTPEKNLRKTETQKLRRAQISAQLLTLKREHAKQFDSGKSLIELEPLRREIKRLSSLLNHVRGHEWYAKTPKIVRQERERLASIPESPNRHSLQHEQQIPQPSSSQHASSQNENRTVSL
jgi:hypothetical protein